MSNAANNGLTGLNNVLFDQICDLRNKELTGDELKAEIGRAKAVNDLAKTVVESTNSAMAAISLRNRLHIDVESHGELKALSEGTHGQQGA